ncbi:MAG TPA: hypothetical protein VMB48_00775 [Steroidobacteraceae bacterium]|nr:hypothetical protein [Steroidobacteraceae bacterium]
MPVPEDLNDPELAGPLADLESILIPEEILQAVAIQRRVFALAHRRVLVAATSGRLIWLSRKLPGGFDVSNIRWQDLEQVSLKVGMISATLIVQAAGATDLASQAVAGGRVITFPGLRTAQAQAVYRICQAQDQAWREKRRIRELEELRARAGGVQIAGAPPAAPAGDAVRRLQEARQMLDGRLISDAEYEAIKARILAGT